MNRKTVWTTHHGQKIRICDMEDTHIANLIHYIVCLYLHWGKEAQDVVNDSRYTTFDDERRRRGLSAEFINKAPYPYVGPHNQLRIWDADRMNSKPFRVITSIRKNALDLMTQAQLVADSLVKDEAAS